MYLLKLKFSPDMGPGVGLLGNLVTQILVFWGISILFSTVKVKLLSRVRLFATPCTIAYQVSLSMGFSRQEYWSGLPLPSPGDLPDSGIEPGSPALKVDALTSEPPGWGVFHSGCTQLPSHQRYEGSLFSTPSPAFITYRLFDDGHSDCLEVIPHCSFDLHFSNH